MQRSWVLVGMVGLGFLASGLQAQTPPANARDITQMPPAGQATAPSSEISAPVSVVRVYVDTLSGADARALAGLITQDLFQSKQVVITENQSNASLILKGTVQRKPVPVAATKRGRARERSSSAEARDAGLASADLPPLGDLGAPVDLSKYVYRLDLQVLNPNGDLVWMSGQGTEALPYQAAEPAVAQTLQPLLAAVAGLTAAAH
ncbi:MAG TPA: hypothetical protein VNF74_12440 [Terriglobales bacterium]|nr:hypothetical protein [Terriglobales bacterium]